MDKLKGKSAIVTGATSGMGRAAAVLFAQEGASVVASGRDEERGAALVQEIRSAGGRAVFVAGDVSLLETNESLVATSVREHGGVDVVMANAGMLGLGSVTDLPVETWRQTLAVNLDSVFYLLRSALPVMRDHGGGSIVVNGSIALWLSVYGSLPAWGLYTGGIAYGLMGLLFAAEYTVRRKRFG